MWNWQWQSLSQFCLGLGSRVHHLITPSLCTIRDWHWLWVSNCGRILEWSRTFERVWESTLDCSTWNSCSVWWYLGFCFFLIYTRYRLMLLWLGCTHRYSYFSQPNCYASFLFWWCGSYMVPLTTYFVSIWSHPPSLFNQVTNNHKGHK